MSCVHECQSPDSCQITLSTFAAKVAAANSKHGIVICFKGRRRHFPMSNEQCTWPSESTNRMYEITPYSVKQASEK